MSFPVPRLDLFSQDCLLCRSGGTCGLLCKACRAELPTPFGGACPRCAAPGANARACGACLTAPPAFSATIAAFTYAFPVDRLVQRFKFQGDLALSALFAEAICERVQVGPRPDLIVAAPLAARRLRERGFNQAAEMARRVAARLAIRFDPRACAKRLDTLPQAELAGQTRRQNLRGAFAVKVEVRGLHIAVVDDVMTTGTTLDELARALCAAGASRVDAWVAARTPAPWETLA
jgi:ComF family protein